MQGDLVSYEREVRLNTCLVYVYTRDRTCNDGDQA